MTDQQPAQPLHVVQLSFRQDDQPHELRFRTVDLFRKTVHRHWFVRERCRFCRGCGFQALCFRAFLDLHLRKVMQIRYFCGGHRNGHRSMRSFEKCALQTRLGGSQSTQTAPEQSTEQVHLEKSDESDEPRKPARPNQVEATNETNETNGGDELETERLEWPASADGLESAEQSEQPEQAQPAEQRRETDGGQKMLPMTTKNGELELLC